MWKFCSVASIILDSILYQFLSPFWITPVWILSPVGIEDRKVVWENIIQCWARLLISIPVSTGNLNLPCLIFESSGCRWLTCEVGNVIPLTSSFTNPPCLNCYSSGSRRLTCGVGKVIRICDSYDLSIHQRIPDHTYSPKVMTANPVDGK